MSEARVVGRGKSSPIPKKCSNLRLPVLRSWRRASKMTQARGRGPPQRTGSRNRNVRPRLPDHALAKVSGQPGPVGAGGKGRSADMIFKAAAKIVWYVFFSAASARWAGVFYPGKNSTDGPLDQRFASQWRLVYIEKRKKDGKISPPCCMTGTASREKEQWVRSDNLQCLFQTRDCFCAEQASGRDVFARRRAGVPPSRISSNSGGLERRERDCPL